MKAELWTWSQCPFCVKAKEILKRHNIEFTEHVMDGKDEELQKVKDKYSHQTVPIIILNGEFVGGCDDLKKLENDGKLS